jgi:cell division transport system permease protein
VDYISKEQAAEIFAGELGEDFVGFIGYNPLYPSLMVNFNVSLLPDNSTEVLDRFCKEVGSEEGVTGVAYQENIVVELREDFYKLTWFLIVLMLVLVLISVVLIGSLIRIALYAQRETIRTMRMVGATTGFIMRPFLRRSIACGAIGGIIASALMVLAIWICANEFQLPLTAQEHWTWYIIIAVTLVVVGIIISWLATAFTVRHHITKN